LVVDDKEINENLGQNSVSHRIDGVKCVYFKKRKMNELLKNQCWICNGWNEIDFKWIMNESGETKKRPVYLHMDFERYTARYTGKCKRSTMTFSYRRMVPPGRLLFMFTADNRR